MIVAFDNGLTGAIVALSPIAGLPPIHKFVMPTKKLVKPARKTTKAKKFNEVDTWGIVRILNTLQCNEETTVYFEECPDHAKSAYAMKSMATSAGKILAVLELKKLKTVRIISHDWQPEILGKVPRGKTKEYALNKARELWPEENWLATKRSTTPHDGMIDAALIAEYGRLKTYPEI